MHKKNTVETLKKANIHAKEKLTTFIRHSKRKHEEKKKQLTDEIQIIRTEEANMAANFDSSKHMECNYDKFPFHRDTVHPYCLPPYKNDLDLPSVNECISNFCGFCCKDTTAIDRNTNENLQKCEKACQVSMNKTT